MTVDQSKVLKNRLFRFLGHPVYILRTPVYDLGIQCKLIRFKVKMN